jgi:Response regulator containing a CheY-like receiver domain and an HD-GYP domain
VNCLCVKGDLLAFVRDLSVAAREQGQRIESLLASMLGDSAVRAPRLARVLVVDDSEDNRELAAAVLEAAGFHVITACNGLEGVVAARCEHPSVVLMDVTMPVLDGIEAARLIKASAGTRHMNILAHTAKPEFYEGPLTIFCRRSTKTNNA